MRAFSLAGRMLGTHGWDPGLESPRLPGVEGSEGSRAMSMGQPAEGLWGGVCVQERKGECQLAVGVCW